jgi:hypothetical protein
MGAASSLVPAREQKKGTQPRRWLGANVRYYALRREGCRREIGKTVG